MLILILTDVDVDNLLQNKLDILTMSMFVNIIPFYFVLTLIPLFTCPICQKGFQFKKNTIKSAKQHTKCETWLYFKM